MLKLISILFAGILFGFGLSLSEMVNPLKVLNFLDVTGTWDPSLILVMAGAVGVTSVASYVALNKQIKPLLNDIFHLPTKKEIDLKLVLGSALFGLGWGLIGICPGPTLAAFVYGMPLIYLFFGSMLAGMGVQKLLFKARKNPV